MSYIYYIGIDIAKDWFDVAQLTASDLSTKASKTTRFPNSSIGFDAFVATLQQNHPDYLIVLEASGGYEMALLTNLVAQGFAVHRAHPLKASHYARSLRINSKTDALDAVALARYGADRHQELDLFHPKNEASQTLQSLHTRRADLVQMAMAEKQRLKHPRYAQMTEFVSQILSAIQAQIQNIEKKMLEIVESCQEMHDKYAILHNTKGIGQTTALSLLACLPELGQLSRRQIASLAGFAPHPKDSGKSTGYRATRGGRHDVKKALYMATLSAVRSNSQIAPFYNRLIQNGKKPIVALIAAARKFIVILNAKIRDIYLKT
jgi:transposase